MARDDGRDHQEEERLPLQRSYEHANAKHRALHQGGRRWQGSRRLSLRTLLPPVSVVCRSHDGCCLFASSPRSIDPPASLLPPFRFSPLLPPNSLSLFQNTSSANHHHRTTKRRRTLALMVTDNYMQHTHGTHTQGGGAARPPDNRNAPDGREQAGVAAGGPHGEPALPRN